jgi:hypothetical protein
MSQSPTMPALDLDDLAGGPGETGSPNTVAVQMSPEPLHVQTPLSGMSTAQATPNLEEQDNNQNKTFFEEGSPLVSRKLENEYSNKKEEEEEEEENDEQSNKRQKLGGKKQTKKRKPRKQRKSKKARKSKKVRKSKKLRKSRKRRGGGTSITNDQELNDLNYDSTVTP